MTLVQKEVKKVYLGTHQVRPAVAPSNLVVFPDTTISDLTNDWRTADNLLLIDTDGLYYNSNSSRGILKKSVSFTSTSVITIRAVYKTGTISSWTWTVTKWLWDSAITGQASGWDWSYAWLMSTSNYMRCWNARGHNSTSVSISWQTNTWYEETLTINLANGTMSAVVTEEWSSTPLATIPDFTLTSTQISNAVNGQTLFIGLEKNYVRVRELEWSIS